MAHSSLRTGFLAISFLLGIFVHQGCLLDMTDPATDHDLPDSSPDWGPYSPGLVPETIAEVRIDMDADGIPDRLYQRVMVEGVVISINLTASGNRWLYHIQDSSGGLALTKGSEPGGGRVFVPGDYISVAGIVTQFNGTTELEVRDIYQDVILLRTGDIPVPQRVTIGELLSSPEEYESEYVQVDGVRPAAIYPWWPGLGAEGDLIVGDGQDLLRVFIDSDSDVDGSPKPSWPASIRGVFRQYDTEAPFNDGYILTPNYRSDFL